MKIKLILSILFFIIFVTPVQSAIIRGGITFSVSEARKISFHNIPYKIPTDSFYNFRKFNKFLSISPLTLRVGSSPLNTILDRNDEKMLRSRVVPILHSFQIRFDFLWQDKHLKS